MKEPVTVLAENLGEEPYASILCYPKLTEATLHARITELKNHGVRAVEFAGRTSIFNMPVLGKGFVGIVVIAHMGRERVALKIRRMDADRQGLLPEAELLAKANSAGVGPKLISVSTNFLLMQLVESELLPAWLETNKEKTVVRNVLTELLEQCRRLDTVGLDHGELSHAPKHVIVDGQTPFIVDFETASINRKPANVTAICQYLFMNSGAVAKMVAEVFGERNRERIVEALRGYKRCRTRRDFELVLKSCLS